MKGVELKLTDEQLAYILFLLEQEAILAETEGNRKAAWVMRALKRYIEKQISWRLEGGKMEEIKFRAWNGEKMIYASLFDLIMWTDEHRKEWVVAVEEWGEKLPVMQFTGLYDKNGKEIYEWDIVKVRNKNIAGLPKYLLCVVEFQDGSFVAMPHLRFYKLSQEDWNKWWSVGVKKFYFPEYVEIVGNIFENPELLRRRKNEKDKQAD